jgi:hypothetical protein
MCSATTLLWDTLLPDRGPLALQCTALSLLEQLLVSITHSLTIEQKLREL